MRDGDTLLLDETRPTTLPVDLYPDATIVNVQMVDFAFALDMNTIPAGPVIFHFANTSYSGAPHVGVTVTLTDGITAEQIIEAESIPEDQMTGFVNALFLDGSVRFISSEITQDNWRAMGTRGPEHET